jgi:hypothetical protein
MPSFLRRFTPLLFAAALAAPVLSAGCAAHVRIYDPYYSDYHVWAAEEPYYAQWEQETHRRHVDFNHRSEEEKKTYWDWRHRQR